MSRKTRRDAILWFLWLAIAAAVLTAIIIFLPSGQVSGAERSGKWPALRKQILDEQPTCEACGGRDGCKPHHIKPFHVYPELELERSNVIVLCDQCHLMLGHLGDWPAWNPRVREDAARHLAEVQHRPYTKPDAAKFLRRFPTTPAKQKARPRERADGIWFDRRQEQQFASAA